MEILGHFVQVLHILIVVAVLYVMTRSGNWKTVALLWSCVVFFGWYMNNGFCPLTLLSNIIYKKAGQEEFAGVIQWVLSFMDVPSAIVFSMLAIGGPLILGYFVRRRKEVSLI